MEWVEIVAPIVAFVTLVAAIIRYFLDERARRDSRRIEATKPFLERQLGLYSETIRVTAVIATSQNEAALQSAKSRFWELFWGELALVEDQEVALAMDAFGKALRDGRDRKTLERLSLSLAHCLRGSLAKSWRTPAWTSHHPTCQEVIEMLDNSTSASS